MIGTVSVQLHDIGKSYAGQVVFSGIKGAVQPGECLVITGRNGAGKSTLIKIIAGLVRPTAGEARLLSGGSQLAGERRKAALGMVSPEVVLYQAMSGYENIRFIARLRGRSDDERELLRCLDAVQLAGRQHQAVAGYSTGMRQRLKMAVMLALQPAVWLLDEPSSNLDESGKQLIAAMIDRALGRKAAVIIATNERQEAYHATCRIALD